MTDDVITTLREIADRTRPPEAFDLEESMRRGRRRARRRTIGKYAAGLVAAATTAVVAVLAWPGGSGPGTGPAPDPSALGAEHLALLGTPQQPADEPPVDAFGGLRMDESTVRAIPTTLSSVRHWVGLDANGSICLAFVRASAVEPDLAQASGCAEPDVFAEDGLWFGAAAGTGSLHAAWLLPDGYEFDPDGPETAPPGPEWTLVADNLAIR